MGMCARRQLHDVEMTIGHAPVASWFAHMAWLGVYHLYTKVGMACTTSAAVLHEQLAHCSLLMRAAAVS